MPSKTELITQVEDLQKQIEQYKKAINRRDSDEKMHKSETEQLKRTISGYEDKAKLQKDQIDELKSKHQTTIDELAVCKKELTRLSDVSVAINEIKSSLSYPSQALNDRILELENQLNEERGKTASIERLLLDSQNLQLENRFLQGKVQAYELQMTIGRSSGSTFQGEQND